MKNIIIAIVKNEAFINAVITAIAALASWAIAKAVTKKPEWKKYEGLLITACKMAEKFVPDGTENKSMKRADIALKTFSDCYACAYGQFPSKHVVAVVKAALPIVHDQLEAKGTL